VPHFNWKGDKVQPQSGRMRALKQFPEMDKCQRCEESPAVDRHHVDNDTLNNSAENVRFLCRRCHMIEDGRTKKVPGVVWHSGRQKWMAQVYLEKVYRVSSFKYLGYYDTKEEALKAIQDYKKL
jgi:AP2 domain